MIDDDTDSATIAVRADTAAFAKDIADMRASLEGSLVSAAERAGQGIESALLRGLRTGKLGFDDLKRSALSALNDIAAAAIQSGLNEVGKGLGLPGGALSIGGGGVGSGGGGFFNSLFSIGTSLITSLLGAPGRATGGPVSPMRPYWVGERGPELFVPTSSGRVETAGVAASRDVRVAITINAPSGEAAPQALARSSRQIARAVRGAVQG